MAHAAAVSSGVRVRCRVSPGSIVGNMTVAGVRATECSRGSKCAVLSRQLHAVRRPVAGVREPDEVPELVREHGLQVEVSDRRPEVCGGSGGGSTPGSRFIQISPGWRALTSMSASRMCPSSIRRDRGVRERLAVVGMPVAVQAEDD